MANRTLRSNEAPIVVTHKAVKHGTNNHMLVAYSDCTYWDPTDNKFIPLADTDQNGRT